MPLAAQRIAPERAQFYESLTTEEMDGLAADPHVRVLQTSEPVVPSFWPALNDSFFARRPDVELRVFGFYSSPCDLTFASTMTNVRRFAADSLHDATGVEHIAGMPKLETLSIGIRSLDSFDVLDAVPSALRSLALGATRSKKPDLTPLSRFKGLRTVFIEGHRKNIDVLSTLSDLEDVTLRSVTTPDVGYLSALRSLWSLDIKLGGIRDLSAIAAMPSIKYLELWQIAGLADVGVVAELPNLQNLFLQSLRRVKGLPDLGAATSLRRVTLLNMKGLTNLSALEHALALEELVVLEAAHLEPDDLVPALRNKGLKRALVALGSDRKNQRAKELMAQFGVSEFRETAFPYR